MADILQFPNLSPSDAHIARSVFEYVQFLLDDDANLTPAGNLTGAAKQKLRTRVAEMAADEYGPPPTTASDGIDLSGPDLLAPETIQPAEKP